MQNPLSIKGYDIDPESGSPEKPPSRATLAALHVADERMGLINDIAGEGGAVLREVTDLFVKRINALVVSDPECIAYEKMFQAVGYKLNIGEKLVSAKVRKLTADK